MASPAVTIVPALCLLAFAQVSRGQQSAVTADGMLIAQNETAIEQARLYQQSAPPVSIGVDENGTALPNEESSNSDDDSFGAQQILKAQEKVRAFTISGGIAGFYTSNVALVRRNEKDDFFAVADAGMNWSPRVAKNWEANVGLHASIFRYSDTPSLDFENLGASVGVAWTPPSLRGASLFARYDFTELLGRDGDQILMDHSFTLGAQRSFSLGRSHYISVGVSGTLGLSDPAVAQRSSLGVFAGYHINLTRKLEADLLFRPAIHFYTDADRTDLNQILSWNLRYRFSDWAELNASFTYGANRSDHSVFDYNLATFGGSAGFSLRF